MGLVQCSYHFAESVEGLGADHRNPHQRDQQDHRHHDGVFGDALAAVIQERGAKACTPARVVAVFQQFQILGNLVCAAIGETGHLATATTSMNPMA